MATKTKPKVRTKAKKSKQAFLSEEMTPPRIRETHGLDLYETADGLVVSVLNKSNCKCKRKKDTTHEGNGEAAE
jgi:hypothetical protein